jgi:hypothetical protein
MKKLNLEINYHQSRLIRFKKEGLFPGKWKEMQAKIDGLVLARNFLLKETGII